VIQPGDVDVLLAPIGRDHRSGYSRVALIAIAPWMPTRIVTAGTSRRDSRVLNLVFSGSDEPFSSPLLHYGVWDNFSPQKNNTQKNTPQSMNMKTKILHVSGCRSGSDCVFYQEGDLVQAKVDLSKIPNWLL
jgi:hypothetical protein